MAKQKPPTAPKYRVIAAEFREQIANRVLKPGDRLPSFTEMRARYGVTPTTVTRVHDLLRREHLIEGGRGRGTFVATPPAHTPTGVIGVSGLDFKHFSHPYNTALMRGFVEASAKAGVEMLLLNDTSSRDWKNVDGVIVCRGYDAEALRPVPPEMPRVALLTPLPDAISVVADEYEGARALLNHLLGLGHRRIAAMFDPLSPRRISGYRDALYDAGIEPNARWMRSIHDEISVERNRYYPEVAYDAMNRWLREDWNKLGCTALVAQNDDTAIGVIEALREAGQSVPEHVSVTGFDGTKIGSYFKPFLTTIEMPLEEIAAAAVELLQRQVAREYSQFFTHTLPVRLVVRDSTAPAKSR